MVERVVNLEGGYVAPWSHFVQVGAASVPITITSALRCLAVSSDVTVTVITVTAHLIFWRPDRGRGRLVAAITVSIRYSQSSLARTTRVA